jgi:DNA-binding LacI/PurR family transcriptional regulator
MKRNRYSLKHIAEISGVSLSSVSRALDPARCHLVRSAVREKINKCVDEVNFSVNLSARRLRLNKAEVITVIVYLDSFKKRNFSVEFVSPSAGRDDIQCLSAAIKAHHYDMKIEFIVPGQQLPIHIFDRQRTDGVIFVSYYGTEYVEHLEKIKLPNLYMSRYIDTSRRDVGLIGLDREPGYRNAIERLKEEGRRRFTWFSPCTVTSLRVNINIVNELFREYDVFDEKRFLTNISCYYDIQDVLKSRDIGDVIFCSNDAIANWVVRELRRNGVRVPEDVAVVGYDNDPAFQGEDSNNLATIDAPKATMAEAAVEQLLAVIDSENTAERPHVLLDTVFIPGDTALTQEKGD